MEKKKRNIILGLLYLTAILILALFFSLHTPSDWLGIVTSEHPLAERYIRASAREFCGYNNFAAQIFFEVAGRTNVETGEITIMDGLSEKQQKLTLTHEECHQEQILNGEYAKITDDNCYELALELERECTYKEYGW